MSLLAAAPTAFGQTGFPGKTSVQIRLGAFMATTLVSDAVSSRALDDSIPGRRSHRISLRQQPGPIGTLALRVPLRPTTQLELSAAAGRSLVRGDDGLTTWDFTNATVANLILGFGYIYRQRIGLHAGVGMTKLFAEERGLFSRGNSVKPLLELGISTGVRLGVPVQLDLRIQTHSYGTATLRDDSGADGNVARIVFQVGTVLGKGASE
ncbi:MAG: hypothetical protein ACT443_16340 [Gemmatimonadota bacterium]